MSEAEKIIDMAAGQLRIMQSWDKEAVWLRQVMQTKDAWSNDWIACSSGEQAILLQANACMEQALKILQAA